MKRHPWWRGGKDGLAGKPEAGHVSTGQGYHPQMVDIHEMARILRVPAGWLYRKGRLREVPFVRLGKYIRFEPQKVVEHYQKTGVAGKAPS